MKPTGPTRSAGAPPDAPSADATAHAALIPARWFSRFGRWLSHVGDCRVWLMYRKDLGPELLPYQARIPIEIEIAELDDADRLAALSLPHDPPQAESRARIFRDRIAAGSLCFVARVDGASVAYNWVRIGTAIGAHGVRMQFADDEIYTTDAHTERAWRGQGIHPALNHAMLAHARWLGFRTAYTLVRSDNIRSAVTMPRVGWQHAGTLLHFVPHWGKKRPIWLTRGCIHPMRADPPESRGEPSDARQPGLSEILERFGQRELISARSWSNTYRLSDGAETVWLKIVAPGQGPTLRLPGLLAREFSGQVAHVLACDSGEQGWLLMRDHAGVSVTEATQAQRRRQLTEGYAQLQARAARMPLLLAAAQPVDVMGALPRLIRFLQAAETVDPRGRVGASCFIGAAQAQRVCDLLLPRADLLQRFWAPAAELPPTLNHARLGLDNMAVRDDGSWVMTSWDGALTGPAGVSMSRVFGGTVRSLRLIGACDSHRDPADTQDAESLRLYRHNLAAGGYATEALLRRALPAAIALGPAIRLESLACRPTDDLQQVDSVRRLVGELLAQIVELADWLAQR